MDVSGPLTPVVVDENWTIFAGHGRVKACELAGRDTVPVVQIFGASEAQKRAYLIADNRIGEDARWNRKKLADGMPDLTVLLNQANFEIVDIGFEVAELDQLAVDFGDNDADPADEVDDAILKALKV